MFDEESHTKIADLAEGLGVEVAALMAIVEVESGGRYFAQVDGRKEPLIRFEGHYFDRLLPAAARAEAAAQGLASPKPGKIANPRRQSDRWKLLNRAIEINRAAALSSCSWGVGQVMGAHWQWLGYGSVDALVAQARSGIAGQIELMARYIERAGLAEMLRARDWTVFARHYNGPGFAKHAYDHKMAAAYQKHCTATEPEETGQSPAIPKAVGSSNRGKSRMWRSIRSSLLSIFKWFN